MLTSRLTRLTLASIAVTSLFVLPLMAGAARVVGVVMSSRGASVANVSLIDGDTITAGALIKTAPDGNALVRLARTTQLSLGSDTAVQFKNEADRVVVAMSSGTAVTKGTSRDAVVVETSGYRVEPAQEAVYVVAILPDKTEVAARSGSLVVTDKSGHRYVVKAGEVAEIAGAPAGVPGQEQESGKQSPDKPAGQASETAPAETKPSAQAKPPAQAAPASHSNNGLIILGGAAAAAVGAGLALAGGGGGGGGSSPPPSSPFTTR